MVESNFIKQIFIEENGLPVPTPEIKHERDLAIYDILQKNEFYLDNRLGNSLPKGPFVLSLSIKKSLLFLRGLQQAVCRANHLLKLLENL